MRRRRESCGWSGGCSESASALVAVVVAVAVAHGSDLNAFDQMNSLTSFTIHFISSLKTCLAPLLVYLPPTNRASRGGRDGGRR
jgi:hypothetical protein